MFGTNPVRKAERREDGLLAVQSIFETIQGEGPFAGCPAIFVRLAGCNLRCWFCDTDFESKIDNLMSVEQIVSSVAAKPIAFINKPLIVLTGGEPLRQGIVPLLEALVECGYFIQIETAGTLWVDGLEEFLARDQAHLVCSPKTPAIHPKIEQWCTDYKYVINAFEPQDPDDGLPYAYAQRPQQTKGVFPVGIPSMPKTNVRLARPPKGARTRATTIWVQPCDLQNSDKNELSTERCTALALHYGYRISIQIHKLLRVE